MKKFICKNCGTVNEIPDQALKDNKDDWLQCTLPEGFEWILPAGKITPVYGEPIYISAMGEHLSYQAYLDEYNIDPEIAYNLMRGKIRAMSGSKMASRNSKSRLGITYPARSKAFFDEDEWAT